jgi:hypothetical protein
VSLLWPSQHRLLLSLGAEQFAAIWQTGFARKVRAQHHERYATEDAHPWKVAIQQLETYIKSLNLSKNTQLSVTLASDLVRYIVLPAHEVAMNTAEKYDYVKAAYREIYGAAVDGWKLCVDDAPPRESTLACAIDLALFDALEQLAQQYQLHLQSVQPHLMAVFNQLFADIKHANAYLALVEQTRVLALRLENGMVQQVRCEKLAHDWQANLQQNLLRDTLLTDGLPKKLMIYAPATEASTMLIAADWAQTTLKIATKNTRIPADYAMLEAFACAIN